MTPLPVVNELVENLPNAFPPRRTPVPDADDDGVMGFFTDATLCIGCKACEVACKQWNQLPADGLEFTGYSYDNTKHLGATTWRHVAFKEKVELDFGKWLMVSDVCKHCAAAPCQQSCPTGSIVYNDFGDVYVQPDICNGCGYCVVACPFGVIDRSEIDGHAHKCTLCFDRQADGMEPACAKACPTDSIQFGSVKQLREKARERVEQLHEQGRTDAYLYGVDSVGDYGPLNSMFLLEAHPHEYNLPVNPPQPLRDQVPRYAAGLFTGIALAAFAALAFRSSARAAT
jgi:formate dehydrogenase iron-sulfur subunit